MEKILFIIAIWFIVFCCYWVLKENEPNKKDICITQVDTIKVFENNFHSTWEVYGCKYYGYKKQDNGK